jgi:hypothetical protein
MKVSAEDILLKKKTKMPKCAALLLGALRAYSFIGRFFMR